jgi:hypothetical protein
MPIRDIRKRSLLESIFREVSAIRQLVSPAPRLIFRIGPVSEQTTPAQQTPQHVSTIHGEVIAMLVLTDNQKCTLSIAPKDAKGADAKLDGVPSWGIDNSDVLELTIAPDALSAEIRAIGPLGTCLVSVQGDADLGSGVAPIAGTLEVTVGPGQAVTIDIVPGTPSDQ